MAGTTAASSSSGETASPRPLHSTQQASRSIRIKKKPSRLNICRLFSRAASDSSSIGTPPSEFHPPPSGTKEIFPRPRLLYSCVRCHKPFYLPTERHDREGLKKCLWYHPGYETTINQLLSQNKQPLSKDEVNANKDIYSCCLQYLNAKGCQYFDGEHVAYVGVDQSKEVCTEGCKKGEGCCEKKPGEEKEEKEDDGKKEETVDEGKVMGKKQD